MSEAPIESEKVIQFVTELLNPVFHQKRCWSIGQAVVGAMHADRLGSAAVGRALAAEFGITAKSGIKQVDRLLGNDRFEVNDVFRQTVPWLVASRKEIVVSLDWTEYASDGHSRIALNLVTVHGRATPLVWMTFETSKLKKKRNEYEDLALRRLAAVLPENVNVILLADRGFADVKLYKYLRDVLCWDFVIRFRGKTNVESASGETRMAHSWVPARGQTLELVGAFVTEQRFSVNVVCVKERAMKDAWCLATTLAGDKGRVVQLYGRRFTCEETFRDEKDRRFGMGFAETSVSTPARRDRFLVIIMLATILLTLLGSAGEQLGRDRELKANTSKRRTHSLFRQGREYLAARLHRCAEDLRRCFTNLLKAHPLESSTYALI